jgi:hypothetical protein
LNYVNTVRQYGGASQKSFRWSVHVAFLACPQSLGQFLQN